MRWVGGLVSSRLRAGVDDGCRAAELFGGIGAYHKQQLLESDFTAGCPVGAAAQEGYGDADLADHRRDRRRVDRPPRAESLTRAGREETDAHETALAAISALEGAIMMARVTRSTRPVDLALDPSYRLWRRSYCTRSPITPVHARRRSGAHPGIPVNSRGRVQVRSPSLLSE